MASDVVERGYLHKSPEEWSVVVVFRSQRWSGVRDRDHQKKTWPLHAGTGNLLSGPLGLPRRKVCSFPSSQFQNPRGVRAHPSWTFSRLLQKESPSSSVVHGLQTQSLALCTRIGIPRSRRLIWNPLLSIPWRSDYFLFVNICHFLLHWYRCILNDSSGFFFYDRDVVKILVCWTQGQILSQVYPWIECFCAFPFPRFWSVSNLSCQLGRSVQTW